LTLSEFLQCQGTVLEFGIPDFSSLSCRSTDDLATVSQAVQHAISLFEPRLSHTQVVAMQDDSGHRGQAKLQISGAVLLGMVLRRVDFDIPVNLSDGVSEAV
jgi:type VI secretion system protein ImpF